MKRLLLLLVLFVLVAASAYATSLKCSIDDLMLMWTGKSKTISGRLMYEHKCVRNHYYWLTSEQMNH